MATIALLGGFWPSGIKTGIACRYLTDYTTTQMFVASSNTQNVINYTDTHDVDEDMSTICTCYGSYNQGDEVGIMRRYMNDSPTLVSADVASYV